MTETLNCSKGCCTLKMTKYIPNKNAFKIRANNRKAGVFIHDPKTDKTLLVQSRGHLWGLPKGSLKYQETERVCAIREAKEETGLKISEQEFTKAMNIKFRAMYYYIERDECEVEVQTQIKDNDANAIGWIKTSCIAQLILDGKITLTQQCRMVFKKFKNITFPHSNFYKK
jgi:ADP-ribose pyrophosphatase YjhB (NUDIX family)